MNMFPQRQQHDRTLRNCIIVGATAGALKAKSTVPQNASPTETLTAMAAGACVGATIGVVIGSFQYLDDILNSKSIPFGQMEFHGDEEDDYD